MTKPASTEMTPSRYTENANAEKRVWGTPTPRQTRAAHFGYAGPKKALAVGIADEGGRVLYTARTTSGALDGATQKRFDR